MKNQESTERVQTKVMYFSLCLIQNFSIYYLSVSFVQKSG